MDAADVYFVDPLDPQFQTLRFLRLATWAIIPFGFVVLLFPWRSRKLAAAR